MVAILKSDMKHWNRGQVSAMLAVSCGIPSTAKVEVSSNGFGEVARGYSAYPIQLPQPVRQGIQWVCRKGRQCTGGLNTHCTPP